MMTSSNGEQGREPELLGFGDESTSAARDPQLEQALAYARRGWAVFPVHAPTAEGDCSCGKADCQRPAKHPAVPNGLKDASIDPQAIREMWAEHPGSNIGLTTGAVSGVIVLDEDGPAGAALVRAQGIPMTPVGKTSKGRHYFFRHPGGSVKTKAAVFAELDSRGDGGYVLAPGSQHATGTMYQWEPGLSPDDVELADAPKWWLDALEPKSVRVLVPSRVDVIPEGRRNNTLTSIAGALRRKGVGEEGMLAALRAENGARCLPALSDEEVRGIVRSVMNYEPAQAEVLPQGITEDGIASEFSARFGDDWRYVAKWGQWLYWDGVAWRPESTLRAFDLARQVCRRTAAMAAKPQESARVASASTVAAVERLAKADRRHAAETEQWDRWPWFLNTPTCVVDLKTGEMRPHDSALFLTKVTTAAPGGSCPTWGRFLQDVTGGDNELQSYLARVVGYALTGQTTEHALFFLYGKGGNGKSVFLNTVQNVLGDYATTASGDTFMASKNERHPTDLAGLRGARMVSAIEIDQGQRWAEAKLKSLTGEDKVSARFMRQDFFEYMPQFKLFVAGNHKPSIRGVDEAMRRRFHLIPFTVTIPEEKRDRNLKAKLLEEQGGILEWAIRGCLDWQRIGLQPPAVVMDATAEYFTEEDAIGRWLEDCCQRSSNVTATTDELFKSWKEWADAREEYVGSEKRLSAELYSRGFNKWRGSTGRRGYIGIGLLAV